MAKISETAFKFHFGLTVADLDAAVRFYRILFGVGPSKHVDDYAKFDVEDPPLLLTLRPGHVSSSGALNHVGFRVASSAALVAVQQRLEANGIRTIREEGVECCYALQTKFWITDADRNMWEVYTLEKDLDHSGFGGDDHRMPSKPEATAPVVAWDHTLMSPVPDRIQHDDQSVDEVHLAGSYNIDMQADRRLRFLREVRRVLKPGGRIDVHGLVASGKVNGNPSLPGPAAMVQMIPLETLPATELAAVGFVGLFHDKLGDIHCFKIDDVELRELRLSGFAPLESSAEHDHVVLYRGPLASVTDERGQSFPRGRRVAVDAATWQLLRRQPFSDDFTCFPCQPTAATPAATSERPLELLR